MVYYNLDSTAKSKEIHHPEDKFIPVKYFDSTQIAQAPRKTLFQYVDKMPRPAYDLIQYLNTNIIYPKEAQRNKIAGRVMVKFKVDDDGNIYNARVIKSVNPEIDAEALRVIAAMPPWQPGMQNGKPIDVYFTQPITFSLQ